MKGKRMDRGMRSGLSVDTSLDVGEDTADSIWLEVYEFPADCVATELSYHFSCIPYSAECRTPLNRMWNPRSSTFVLEFSSSDAQKIMTNPTQFLDEDDLTSAIKVNQLQVRRSAQVLVTCEHEISSRMVKNYFKRFGEVETCYQQQYAILFGDYRAILTFRSQSVAEQVVSVNQHQITPSFSVKTQLLQDDIQRCADEPTSPTGTSYSLSFDMDSVSSILPAYKPIKAIAELPSTLSENPLTLTSTQQPHDSVNSSLISGYQNMSSIHVYETVPSLPTEYYNQPLPYQPTQQSPDVSQQAPALSTTQVPPPPDHYAPPPPLPPLNIEEVPPVVSGQVPAPSVPSPPAHQAPVPPFQQAPAPVVTHLTVPSTQRAAALSAQKAPAASVPPPPTHQAPVPPIPVPTVSLQSCVQVKNCIIRLVKGDLSNHAADVLVHSSGATSQALYMKCNTMTSSVEIIQTIEVRRSESITITTAPNLAAKFLIGFKLCHSNVKDSQRKLVTASLQHCEKLKVRSIAFPALGIGCLGESAKTMAPVLLNSIVEYLVNNAQTTLEIIDVVIYTDNALHDYVEAMTNHTRARSPTKPNGIVQKVLRLF